MLSPSRKWLSLYRLGLKQTPIHREAAVLFHRPSPTASILESTFPLVPHHSAAVCLETNQLMKAESFIRSPLQDRGFTDTSIFSLLSIFFYARLHPPKSIDTVFQESADCLLSNF